MTGIAAIIRDSEAELREGKGRKVSVMFVQCCATVEDRANGSHYNLSRSFTTYPNKQCSRTAKSKVGKLFLCAVHARLALDGFLSEHGRTYRAIDVRVHRDKKTRPEHWAEGLTPEELR